MITFQEILRKLSHFWEEKGCIIHQGYDIEVGAGTFNPATFLRCLGPEPYNAAYIEPSRRPTDGRYGTNPNRLQHYFQYQTVLKPSPIHIQEMYLESLEAIGFDLNKHDIRFVHDDWESPTLGAWGLGWEVWMDGMEITQFTYFQSFGGFHLKPITGEITYGIERLAMYLQNVDTIFDLQWDQHLTYGDIYHRNEVEMSQYNFELANTEMWFRHFEDFEKESKTLIDKNLPLPAFDFVMKASHAFNILDARGVISVTERTGYIARIRDLSCLVAKEYIESREKQGFPLMKRFPPLEIETLPTPPQINQKLLEEGAEDYLLEIGSEELPASFVPIGLNNLKKDIIQLLEKEGITHGEIKTYGTPRRLAIYIKKLTKVIPSEIIQKKGPPTTHVFDEKGGLKPAGIGFFRSLNIEPATLTEIQEGKIPNLSLQNNYLYAKIELPGKKTAIILRDQLPKLITNLNFPKKMKWGNLDITYARPLRWIVSLYGNEVVPFVVGNIISGRILYGHRQLSPKSFELDRAQNYLSATKEHDIMVDITERRESIINQLDQLEKTFKGKIVSREKVVPEVVNLVEWPKVTQATFNEIYLKAPKEVLISEMVEHQKYFPVSDENGKLMNRFIITSNTNPTEHIRKGNQKVLSARLADGVFLYEKGLKIPLEQYNEKLKQVTFQKELGTVYEKVLRIKEHVKTLQKYLSISTPKKAERAATLCKADLATEMVFEFPELQGTIGKYYAEVQGEDSEVANAIEEHWWPKGEKGDLPKTEAGILVSLADKIDNLIGCFCVGLKPTSSSDPYALRRQTLGIIKILISRKQRLPLLEVFEECFQHIPKKFKNKQVEVIAELKNFIINRIKTVFIDYQFQKDEIEASISYNFSDIYDTFLRVKALNQFRRASHFTLLYEVFKRARGQLIDQQSYQFTPTLLREKAEKKLDQLLLENKKPFEEAITDHKYDKAYQLIANIQPALATLFDEVKILDDEIEIQQNRIALLQRVFGLFEKLIDFSKIQEK